MMDNSHQSHRVSVFFTEAPSPTQVVPQLLEIIL